jgi:anti-sigma28 factor (negative regulator of flagellin synthesis)
MQELLSKHQALVSAGFANMERAAELKKQIQNGDAFDLTAGWTYEILQ